MHYLVKYGIYKIVGAENKLGIDQGGKYMNLLFTFPSPHTHIKKSEEKEDEDANHQNYEIVKAILINSEVNEE